MVGCFSTSVIKINTIEFLMKSYLLVFSVYGARWVGSKGRAVSKGEMRTFTL